MAVNGKKDSLDIAYKHNSSKQLFNFLNTWHKHVKPVSDSEVAKQPDTVKNAYAAATTYYINFYKSRSLFAKLKRMPRFFVYPDTVKVQFIQRLVYSEAEIDSFIAKRMIKYRVPDSIRKTALNRVDGKLSTRILTLMDRII
ncbi:hypothetical protein GCM10028827_00600 [Mucilaginibacter myungsuensis]